MEVQSRDFSFSIINLLTNIPWNTKAMSVEMVQRYLPWISAMLFTEITKNESISEAKNRAKRPTLLLGSFINPPAQSDAFFSLAIIAQVDSSGNTTRGSTIPLAALTQGEEPTQIAQEGQPVESDFVSHTPPCECPVPHYKERQPSRCLCFPRDL